MGAIAGDVIDQAFRELNLITIGRAPTAEEVGDTLPRLEALVSSLMGYELGAPLRLWHLPEAWDASLDPRHPLTPENLENTTVEPWQYLPPNVRVVVKGAGERTVYLPGSPPDGARLQVVDAGSTVTTLTLNANGLLVAGASTLAVVPASVNGTVWFFREDLGDWIQLPGSFLEGSEMPLPDEFDDLFVCGLALRISRRYGVAATEEVIQRYTDMLQRATNRYRMGGDPLSPAELRTLVRTTP